LVHGESFDKIGLATFWVIFLQTRVVTLIIYSHFYSIGPNALSDAIVKQQQQQQQQQQRNMLQPPTTPSTAAMHSPAGFSPAQSTPPPPSASQRRLVRSRRSSTANDGAAAGLKSTRDTADIRSGEKSKGGENSQIEKLSDSRKGDFRKKN
jgi:hypothetical protein